MAAKFRNSKPRSVPPGFSFVSKGCSLDLEHYFWQQGITTVIGVDEAGRGPLAGPVVAAAAILPADFKHATLTDSKKLTPARREAIYTELKDTPGVFLAYAQVTAAEIDKINILKATHMAMQHSVKKLATQTTSLMCLIDGLPVPHFPYPQQSVVKGDALCLSIAAASIVAKVERDKLMHEAHQQYPQYGFAQHKGYGTASHLAALKKHGPCPLHRLTFAPLAQEQLELNLQFDR